MNNAPLLRLTGLWLRASAKGGEYLVGRLGAAKLLILTNTKRVDDSDPTHIAYLVEPTERPAATNNAAPESRQRRQCNAYQHLRPKSDPDPSGDDARPFDDPIPF